MRAEPDRWSCGGDSGASAAPRRSTPHRPARRRATRVRGRRPPPATRQRTRRSRHRMRHRPARRWRFQGGKQRRTPVHCTGRRSGATEISAAFIGDPYGQLSSSIFRIGRVSIRLNSSDQSMSTSASNSSAFRLINLHAPRRPSVIVPRSAQPLAFSGENSVRTDRAGSARCGYLGKHRLAPPMPRNRPGATTQYRRAISGSKQSARLNSRREICGKSERRTIDGISPGPLT